MSAVELCSRGRLCMKHDYYVMCSKYCELLIIKARVTDWEAKGGLHVVSLTITPIFQNSSHHLANPQEMRLGKRPFTWDGLFCVPYMAPSRSLGWPRSWFHNQATAAVERPPPSTSIPQSVLVDEEVVSGYDRSTFYPAYPGQILDGRFELKAKIGWGSSSTVWLAKDISW